MKIYQPLGDKVLIEVTTIEKTASGIIMPDSSNDNIKTGIIIAIGPGLYSNTGALIPMDTKIGQTVMFQLGMSTQKVRLDNIDYYMCREPELLLIVGEELEDIFLSNFSKNG